jgi:hypothetical protein
VNPTFTKVPTLLLNDPTYEYIKTTGKSVHKLPYEGTLTTKSRPIPIFKMAAEFQKAATDVKSLEKPPSQDEMLSLYGLYKIATGEKIESATQPGMFDLKVCCLALYPLKLEIEDRYLLYG